MQYCDIQLPVPVEGPFTYSIPDGLNPLPGMRAKVTFGKRSLTGQIVRVHDEAPTKFAAKDILSLVDDEPIFDERLIALARYTALTYVCTMGECLDAALPSAESRGNRLKKRFSAAGLSPLELVLTGEQQLAADAVLSSRDKEIRSHLLFGVTGSGKTEVYVKLIHEVVASGKSALFLVPEISLCSQLHERLSRYFGDAVVLYHSGMTPNQRLDSWMRFYSGDAPIAVGTRSAVFMQCPSLGLIIIDEEHDSSYKEHSTPRYSARRIAMRRVRDESALLVLGSATPSVETMFAAENGVFAMHKLVNRYGGATLPSIEIVKVSAKTPDSLVSTQLKLHTKRAIDAGKQAIYLLNRRGFSPMVLCDSCGEKIQCPDCSISLNFHSNGSLICHYCGYSRKVPEVCPSCGHREMVKVGSGTQRMEEVVEQTFHTAKLFRLDQDTSRKKDASYDLVGMMNSGEIDILLGTQMVSKGFDFPNVTVVGVLLADIGMGLPDFRASERIFSLLMQVSGRCGRGDNPGRVIIQTVQEENELLRYVTCHDYEGFYRRELSMRRMLGYPPFSRLARFLIRGKDEKKVGEIADRITAVVTAAVKDSGAMVLGPAPAPLEKIGGNFRHHIIVKAKNIDVLRVAARAAYDAHRSTEPYLEIDIDPYDML
jgi:primosomal protein N' (replication factor Y)